MFRVFVSCAGAIAVAVIVGLLLSRTLKSETARQNAPHVATLSNGEGSKEPVQAFTTTEALADYLVAAAEHDKNAVNRILKSPKSVALEADTKIRFEHFSGAGQALVTVQSGAHSGEAVYVSYAVIQQGGAPGDH